MKNPAKSLKFGIFLIIMLMTACDSARMEMKNPPQTSPPDKKLECGLKSYLTVWQNSQLVNIVIPFSGTETSLVNYGYRNFSAHPKVGPPGQAETLTMFFYQGPDGLSFNLILDTDSGSVHDNRADISLTVRHNNHVDSVLFSDEAGELLAVDADPTTTFYRGRFNYKLTTDGGIIGPLQGPDFQIDVDVIKAGEINKAWTSINEKSNMQTLDLHRTITFKFADVDPCL